LGVKPVDSAILPRAEFVAPKTSLESDLAEIWRRVLRTDEVGRDDDFFALGGDSILAAELFVAVSQAFAVKLPLAILLEAPTIATLAQRIESAAAGGGAQMGPLIPVQPQGGLPALFCVAGLDGNLLGFSRLARELGPDQPVWTFAPPYVNEARSSFTIQELALEYLEGIRVLQSQGPYYLLGNCFGGLVAYEMACQLSQQGEESLLFMLDTFNRSWSRGLPWRALMRYRLRHGVTRARFQLEKLAHLNALDRLRHLRDRSAAFLRETQLRFAQQVYQRCIENGGPLPKLARDLRCASRYSERRYVPRSFSGEAVLFRTVEPLAYAYDEAFMGWKGLLTGDVEVCDIPGEHLHSLSLPGVNVVGPEVTRYLGIYRSSRQAYSLGGATRN
jgi:thioesterase domain-containing protein/acyl carrier protein